MLPKKYLEPLRFFITGGSGVEKLHLMQTVCIMLLAKNLNLYSGWPDKLKILILAPTGIAPINLDGTTNNSGFIIPPFVNDHTLPSLSDSERRVQNK